MKDFYHIIIPRKKMTRKQLSNLIANEMMGYTAREFVELLEIKKAASKKFGISVTELVSANRSRKYTFPRFICYWVSRNLSGASLPQIGRHYGNRDHTSIAKGANKVDQVWPEHYPEWYTKAVKFQKEMEKRL